MVACAGKKAIVHVLHRRINPQFAPDTILLPYDAPAANWDNRSNGSR
jgi:hypothetical protein